MGQMGEEGLYREGCSGGLVLGGMSVIFWEITPEN
jgi:hypothetical protein